MKKLCAILSVFLLAACSTSHASTLKIPGLPDIPEELLVINENKTTPTERCFAWNLQSGEHNLIGCLHLPTQPKPKNGYPTVILFHGFRGSKTGGVSCAYRKLARSLTKHGIACVRFDMAGCGDSEGFTEEIPVCTYLKNGEDILQAVIRHPDLDSSRLGISGFSLGCHTTFYLARTYYPQNIRIRAITVWAAIADGAILFKEIYDSLQKTSGTTENAQNMGKHFGFGPPPLIICTEDVQSFLSLQDHIVLNSLPSKMAVLHMHGLDDSLVSLTHQALFRNTAPANVTFKTYPQTGHSLDSTHDLEQVIQDITQHFQNYL